MHRIDPTSARLFLAIVEAGSIARAAAREHIVPSAVSRRLAELESMFEVALVERGPRGVTPTPAGEALAHHARLLLRTIERMDLEMSEYRRGVRGHVRLRASASSLAAGLPSLLQAFTREHEGVKLDLVEQDTPDVFRQVAEGHADVGVAPDIVRHQLQVFPYHRYDLCAVVPEDHPLARLETARYAQTLEFDQVELTYGSALSTLLDAAAAQSGVAKRTRIRAMGFESVCRMIGTGMGIGVGPSFLAPTHGPLYRLRFVPLDEPWAHPLICVLVRDLESLPQAARLLVERLRAAWPVQRAGPAAGGR
ncbi:MAG TPA: LysR family transcriptional regulator [Burkholderiaceae bacterium]|nr:LysR family transcriptional regulator [Burkholderiaceae bacterium]